MAAVPGLRFRGFRVPESELSWSFDTPGGPGGQHANRTASRATVSLDISSSEAFPEPTRARLLAHLADRLNNGVLTVSVDETRSQWRNRALARKRMIAAIETALLPVPERRPTRPTGASRRRRLADKRRRSQTKRLRRNPEDDE